MIKVTIKNFEYPLITAEKFSKYSEDFLMTEYFLKPKFAFLPDFDGLDDEEKDAYLFKSIPEDNYLVGLEVIAETWLSKGFCGRMLEALGLVIVEAFPLSQEESKYHTKSLMRINFEHISRGYSNKDCIRLETVDALDDDE